MWKASLILIRLVGVTQDGLLVFKVEISKIYHKRQAILIIFCISESLALIISNIGMIFRNLNP